MIVFVTDDTKLLFIPASAFQMSYFIAITATLLWALNPIHVQAVTYIVQRMASMAGIEIDFSGKLVYVGK